MTYDYVDIYGCQGSGSTTVEIGAHNEINLSPKDTSFTWYNTNMSINVMATTTQNAGVKWKALNGGSFDDDTELSTGYRFVTDKEATTVQRALAFTDNATKTCPADSASITLLIHRTPCIDFEMDLDLTSSLLKLTP